MNLPKRPWIAKDDSSFFLILLISAVLHLSAVVYLSTIEIKKREMGEAIRSMPRRITKLLLQPPVVVSKKPALSPPKKKEEVKDESRVVRKEVEIPGIPGTLLEKTSKAGLKKEAGVRSKGLLGVIMAKTRPAAVPVAVFRDIDKVVKDINKVVPEDRVKDVLASIKGIEGIEEVPVKAPAEDKPRDTSDIIKEKKEVVLGLADKKKDIIETKKVLKKYDEEVYAALISYTGGLKYLYNNALRKDPSLKGRIKVKIIVSSNGRAREVHIESSTLNSKELEEAIVNRIYLWRFPEFKGVADFSTDYTFDFSPVD